MGMRQGRLQRSTFSISLKKELKYVNYAAIFTGSFVIVPSVNVRNRSEELQKNR